MRYQLTVSLGYRALMAVWVYEFVAKEASNSASVWLLAPLIGASD